jgi:HD superfamily phosphodiesterase
MTLTNTNANYIVEIKEILYNRPAFHYEQAFEKIEAFLITHLPTNYTYHTIHHIRDVVDQAEKIAKKEKMSKAEIEDIKLAAWLHDVGYIWEPRRHEARGAEYATTVLTALNFPKAKINKIKSPFFIDVLMVCVAIILNKMGKDKKSEPYSVKYLALI